MRAHTYGGPHATSTAPEDSFCSRSSYDLHGMTIENPEWSSSAASSRASSHDGSRPSDGGNPNLKASGSTIPAEHTAAPVPSPKGRARQPELKRSNSTARTEKVELDGLN